MQASQVYLSLTSASPEDDEFHVEMAKMLGDEERIPPTNHGYVFRDMYNADSDDDDQAA